MTEIKPGDVMKRVTTGNLAYTKFAIGDTDVVTSVDTDRGLVSFANHPVGMAPEARKNYTFNLDHFEKVGHEPEPAPFKQGDRVRRIIQDGPYGEGVKVGDEFTVGSVEDEYNIRLSDAKYPHFGYDPSRFELVQPAPEEVTLESSLRSNLRDLETQVSALRKQIRATHVLLSAEKEKKNA